MLSAREVGKVCDPSRSSCKENRPHHAELCKSFPFSELSGSASQVQADRSQHLLQFRANHCSMPQKRELFRRVATNQATLLEDRNVASRTRSPIHFLSFAKFGLKISQSYWKEISPSPGRSPSEASLGEGSVEHHSALCTKWSRGFRAPFWQPWSCSGTLPTPQM